MIDYRYLKAFMLTAEHHSFSKAAQALSIAQSAVSRQIKLLEEGLGHELIMRSSKKVVLTPKGHELYVAARHFDQVAEKMFLNDDKTPLRLGVLHGLLETWLTPALCNYYKKYNRIVSIHVDEGTNLIRGMETGRFDCIFTTHNVQSELLTSLKLFDEQLFLVSKFEVNLKKLWEYRWIAFSKNDHIFRMSKRPAEVVVTVDSITSVANFVRAGVGIAVLPGHILKKSDRLFRYPVENTAPPEVFMTTLSFKNLPQGLAELSEVVQHSSLPSY